MSVHVQSAANRIFQEFNTNLLTGFNDAPSVHEQFSMEMPSSSRSLLHAWLTDQATVREWKGARILNEFGTITWEVINRNWELSWRFHENQIRDDLSGLVGMAIMKARSYGAKWKRHEDLLIRDTMQGGVSSVCYDGQDFFSATHPIDIYGITPGTFSNYNTGKTLNGPNLAAALAQLWSYKLPDGSPWVPPGSPIALIHDTSNQLVAAQLTGLPWIAQAALGIAAASQPSMNILANSANPFGAVKPIHNQWLNNEAGVWYLAAKVDGMSGVIFQRRQGVETQEQGPGTSLYFERKEILIGQDARYEGSYAHPELMIRNEP